MRAEPGSESPSPLWINLFRLSYRLLFVALLLAGAYYLMIYMPGVHERASLTALGHQVVPQQQYGEIVYISARQAVRLNLYGAALAFSLLLWLLSGILFEMVFKIPLFRQPPHASSPKPGLGRSGPGGSGFDHNWN